MAIGSETAISLLSSTICADALLLAGASLFALVLALRFSTIWFLRLERRVRSGVVRSAGLISNLVAWVPVKQSDTVVQFSGGFG